jgi:hypothetical protein
LLIALMAMPARAGVDRVWELRFRWFPVSAHYGFQNYYGMTAMVALALWENGPDHNIYGHDSDGPNNPVCPCLNPADRKLAQAHLAMIRAMQTWIFQSEWNRREFFKWYGRWYHSSGNKDRDAAYGAQINAVWKRAEGWMALHGNGKDMDLFAPTATGWCP